VQELFWLKRTWFGMLQNFACMFKYKHGKHTKLHTFQLILPTTTNEEQSMK